MSELPRLRVLVVEDDRDACENLCDILALDSHSAVGVATGAKALARVSNEEFHVILLDWRLPDATADTLLPQFRKIAPETAVIVSTAVGGIEQAILALRHGAVDYIAKPVDADLLRAGLRRIAEQKRLKQEKARADAAFRSLVESAGSVILILKPDSVISYINPFGEQLTGYHSADAVDQECVDLLVPEESREQVREILSRVVSGHPERGYEWPMISRDGSLHWVLWNIQFLGDLGGAPAVLAIGQDVTARKEAEEKLLQAERLAAIGQAMTGLAHESRNALQRGQADLELLSLMVEDRPDAMALVRRLQRAQMDLHRLYEEVRQYAAPLSLTLEPHDLSQVVREAWELLSQSRHDRDAALEIEGIPDRSCRVDRFLMLQAFRNILENSLAATPDPVRIKVHFREESGDETKSLIVTLLDNGPGLPQELGETVLNAFVTTSSRGTGLGLAIVRRIVEAHRGQVRLGQPADGAEIVVELPR